MTTGTESETAKLIAELARKSAGHVEIVDIEAPEGAHGLPSKIPAQLRSGENPLLSSVDALFAPYRTAPERRRGTAKTTTLDSFVDLVNRHSDAHSVIFAETAWPTPKLTAICDYHETNGDARFGQHRVEYAFPVTEELKAWIAFDAKPQPQLDFATFLEDHAAELSSPTDEERAAFEPLFKERFAEPTELLQLSRGLEINVGAKIKRQERLQTGERTIRFEEEHTNAEGATVDIPGLFMVSVIAFINGAPVRMPTRLRYRVKGSDVVWFYQLYRWQEWLRQRVRDDLAIAEKATSLPTFEGAPEA